MWLKTVDKKNCWRKWKKQNFAINAVDNIFGEGIEGNKPWGQKLWSNNLAKEIKPTKPDDKICGNFCLARELKETKSGGWSCGPKILVKEIKKTKQQNHRTKTV